MIRGGNITYTLLAITLIVRLRHAKVRVLTFNLLVTVKDICNYAFREDIWHKIMKIQLFQLSLFSWIFYAHNDNIFQLVLQLKELHGARYVVIHLIPTFERQRQIDFFEFESNPVYIESSRLPELYRKIQFQRCLVNKHMKL